MPEFLNKYNKYKSKYLKLKSGQVGGSKFTLGYAVFTAPSKPLVMKDSKDMPPGEKERVWPPTSATLIYGKQDAVLVDPLMTIAEAKELADWIAMSGKNLTTIYATHGHGDHFMGVNTILERWPTARFVATPGVVDFMKKQAAPDSMAKFWNTRFPTQIVQNPIIATPLVGDRFTLEGHDLIAVDTGRTDTFKTTVLHVPVIGLVVAGDVVYDKVHLHLVDSASREARMDWIAALNKVEGLGARVVIAGHKWPGDEDSPRNIEETRQYIRDFDRLGDETKTAGELYDKMLGLYPHRLNLGALWDSARLRHRLEPSLPHQPSSSL